MHAVFGITLDDWRRAIDANTSILGECSRRADRQSILTTYGNFFCPSSRTEANGFEGVDGTDSSLARNWAAYYCSVRMPNGECIHVRDLECNCQVSSVMERSKKQELYCCGRRLERDEYVARSIPRGAILHTESSTGLLLSCGNGGLHYFLIPATTLPRVVDVAPAAELKVRS